MAVIFATSPKKIVICNDAPAWYADGKRIVFESADLKDEGDIYVMDADRHNHRKLTDDRWFDGTPSWSSRWQTDRLMLLRGIERRTCM